MDTRIIGLFLAKLRKDNQITQKKLGEIVGVTNKTVSRWESVNYIPPVDILLQLSDIYHISINEILSGRILSDEEYKKIAEDNLMKSWEYFEAKKKRWNTIFNGFLISTNLIAIMVITLVSRITSTEFKAEYILVIALVLVLTVIVNTLNTVLYVIQKEK